MGNTLGFYREKVSREETIPKAPNQCWTTRGHFPSPQRRKMFSASGGNVSSVRTANPVAQQAAEGVCGSDGKLPQMCAHSRKFERQRATLN